MSTWDVILVNDTVKRVTADRYVVTDNGVEFYIGPNCIALFAKHQWIGLTLREVSMVPTAPAITGVIG